jgi:hypothetical protein
MRNAVVVAGMLVAVTAHAETKPQTVRGETIVIEGKAPPVKPPKGVKHYANIAPPYSDYAIEHDTWTRAWLVLDIDERGTVQRVKFLKRPGADLDQIAIDRALSMRFSPAEDATGRAIRTQILWPIEWPSYWWLVSTTGFATGIPTAIYGVPCANSGRPLNLDSAHPVYRDCSMPDFSKATSERWISR